MDEGPFLDCMARKKIILLLLLLALLMRDEYVFEEHVLTK